MTDAELEQAAEVYRKIEHTPAVLTPEQQAISAPVTFEIFLNTKWKRHKGGGEQRIYLGEDMHNGL